MMESACSVKLYKSEGEALVTVCGTDYRVTMADYLAGGFEDGAFVDDDGLAFLEAAAEKLSCIKKAFVYLSYRALSVGKLRSKLKTAGFGADAVDRTVELLLKKGYLDDRALCAEYAASLQRTKLYGASRLKKELYAKGFDADCINAALDELYADGEECGVDSAIKALLAKKFPGLSPDDREGRAKATAYLYRMGYSYDDINNAISTLGRN